MSSTLQLYAARRFLEENPLDKAARTALRNAERDIETLEKNVAHLRESAEQRYKKNMKEQVLRVTLQKDVSMINARIAEAEGEVVRVDAPPLMVCVTCGNADETAFLTDNKHGDTVCTRYVMLHEWPAVACGAFSRTHPLGCRCWLLVANHFFVVHACRCGTVAVEHLIHDGDWTRAFEDEESQSQIGPAPDPLLSNRFNLRTGMALVPGVSKATMKQLRVFQEAVEMSAMSVAGISERRTREGYKDKQKLRTNQLIEQVGERLMLSTGVIARARAIFAAFRDNREHLSNYNESVAASMIAAYEEAVMKRRLYAIEAARISSEGGGAGAAAGVARSSPESAAAAAGASAIKKEEPGSASAGFASGSVAAPVSVVDSGGSSAAAAAASAPADPELRAKLAKLAKARQTAIRPSFMDLSSDEGDGEDAEVYARRATNFDDALLPALLKRQSAAGGAPSSSAAASTGSSLSRASGDEAASAEP